MKDDGKFMLHQIPGETGLSMYDVVKAIGELALKGRICPSLHSARVWTADEVGKIKAHLGEERP